MRMMTAMKKDDSNPANCQQEMADKWRPRPTRTQESANERILLEPITRAEEGLDPQHVSQGMKKAHERPVSFYRDWWQHHDTRKTCKHH